MKNTSYAFVLFMFLLAQLVNARTVTINIPDETSVGKIDENYDGTYTIHSPKVWIDGEWATITSNSVYDGLCSIFKLGTSVRVELGPPITSSRWIQLGYNGIVVRTEGNSIKREVKKIICTKIP